ncbi:IS110 family transposase [Massilia cavernae]|uniref:IS110 family transposase n=1 Tax=Massilia cavernae TaxID=2320864 RepID=A0A418XGG4_9BURK|nr:IS110 family transposase [Massilia cavernae]RJG11541.1 IS110 family transposase [Massilia cavernae]RJG15491.1 IS110 family transposase [Massilia cavernae]RJG21193.1 IS110 family transposase [Massilia cavernae]RJG21823.1 IS110 family transposase [Massilia cavernae]
MPARENYFTPAELILAVSLELASKKWKIALHDGQRENAAIRTVDGEEPMQRLRQVLAEIARCKEKWGLPENVRVVVLFEAGQDGFWIARALEQFGVKAVICDPASLQVARHARRAKTDRLDAIALVSALRAWLGGKRDAMRIIRIPPVEAEGQRHLARDRGELQKEVLQHCDRMRKLLRTVGCWTAVAGDFKQRLEQGKVRCYDGSPLPQHLLERLLRECERMALVEQQYNELEKSWFKQLPATVQDRVSKLQRLRAIGDVGSERLVLELFWRNFENRRQVGAAVGLVPQPYDSGNSHADQGISKQGNRRVRSLLIEMSWFWLRYQPESAISRWFAERTGGSKSKRGRRIAIVAVARRLVIALWRYLEHDVVPDGARLKTAAH